MTRIHLRLGEPPADDDVVVIHMGAGLLDAVVAGALRNHDSYIGLLDDIGRFTISVFAVTAGVSEVEILEALPQGQFGRAAFGDLRRRSFDVLATSVLDRAQPVEMQRLQRVHFDVVIPVPGSATPVGELSPADLAALRERLGEPVASVLALFVPRRRK